MVMATHKIIAFFILLIFASALMAQDPGYCGSNPDAFRCVSDSEKIQLNRDLITRSTNSNRQRVFSLENSVNELGGGIAASMAMGSHQFDPSSDGLQGSVAISGYEGDSGISFSIGAPVTESSFLNVSGARGSHGVSAVAASFTWGF